MHAADRQMHLGVFVLGTGNHIAGWRMDGAFTTHMDLPVMQEIARIAERGKFDLLFISDSMAMDPSDHPSFMCSFEPTTLITALAACTTHIGLGATVSTSFSEPFNVARIFGSIDHINDPAIIELIALAGFDFASFTLEHAGPTIDDMLASMVEQEPWMAEKQNRPTRSPEAIAALIDASLLRDAKAAVRP